MDQKRFRPSRCFRRESPIGPRRSSQGAAIMSGVSVPQPLPMDEPPHPPATSARPKTLADLDADSLCHAASFLSLRDISNLAVTCKPLRDVAYSDSCWLRLFRERWPYLNVSCGASGIRAEYLARHIALHQLKFTDPLAVYLTSPGSHSHILLNGHDIIVSQGTSITIWNPGFSVAKTPSFSATVAHSARITCMRLFPTVHTSSFRHETQTEDTVLITSSCDRTIRLWCKDRPNRRFKGHNGPVTTLADKFLGDCGSKLLASGGEDCTVRLWSVNSSGKRHPLLLTYHGHEKPISFLSVARHKPSLLVSIARDSRVRVWDTAAPRPSTSSSCVGMSTLSGAPIGMQCDGNLCYIAAGSSVTAIDLRTMDKVCSIAVHPPRIHSFAMLPSKWLICTGGEDKAMLWDVRKSGGRPEPVTELVHSGLVTLLHMDQYKVVTGGTSDYHVNVWETDTGSLANSLDCRPPGDVENIFPLSAMAVDGYRIVTGGCAEEPGVTYYRDFSDCMVLSSQPDGSSGSKFWDMS